MFGARAVSIANTQSLKRNGVKRGIFMGKQKCGSVLTEKGGDVGWITRAGVKRIAHTFQTVAAVYAISFWHYCKSRKL